MNGDGTDRTAGDAPEAAHDEVAEELRNGVAEFEGNPLRAGRALYALLIRHPEAFAQAGLAMLPLARPSIGYQRLVHLLVEHDILLTALCDRESYSVEEAAQMVRAASRVDPLTDAKLLRRMLAHLSHSQNDKECEMVRKILGVFDAASLGRRLLPLMVQLLRTSDPHVRSKVATMFGKGNRQVSWALDDPDPRVRANAIEALWGVESNAVRQILWKAARDAHNRVAGNAILGLLRLEDQGAVAMLNRMSSDQSAAFRATAAWVMGQSGDRALTPPLEKMMDDPDENVRRNALLSLTLLREPEPEPATPEPAEAKPGKAPVPPGQEAGPEETETTAGTYAPVRGLSLGTVRARPGLFRAS